MRNVIFKLKIPLPDKENEYQEFKFEDPNDICKKLDISTTTLYRIINKTMKFTHNDKKYLEGIIIERELLPLKYPKRIKKSAEDIAKEKKEFRNKILDTLTSPSC